MASTAGALRGARTTTPRGGLGARLGAALDGLLDHLGEGPALISGDADSSLLAIARDLELEDRALCRRFGR